MPRPTTAELVPGQSLREAFVLTGLKLAPFRNKPGHYLDLRLADRLGELPGRLWEGAEAVAASVTVGTVVMVEARVDEYKGEKQLVVDRLRPAHPDEFNYADLVRVATRPQAEMLEELDAALAEIENPHLSALLARIFHDRDLRHRFAHAPAAERLHHACVGGLLQHTLSVVAVCRQAALVHPELDRDLLLAGALLHDFGKVWELTGELAFQYTDTGRFCGHLVLTDRFVTRQIERLEDFPPRLADLLTHLLLSHHGRLEWGAPIRPALPEALALHFADNLDAKLQIAADFMASPDARDGDWTKRHWELETRLYLGPSATDPGPDSAAPEAASEGALPGLGG